MKNTNNNKILSIAILVGIVITLSVIYPLGWNFKSGSLTSQSAQKTAQKSPGDLLSSTPLKTANTGKMNSEGSDLNPPVPLTALNGNHSTQAEKEPSKALAQTFAQTFDGCFNLTFSHKQLASHEDGEACLLHKNLIVLNHPEQNPKSTINQKSICMRVNGKAVKYSRVSGKSNQVLLGAEAGPNAKITASYCVGKAKCALPCTPEKDQFLSAIGADDNGDQALAEGWDGQKGKSADDAEVDNQMAGLSQDLSQQGSEHSQIFEGWILEAQTAKCEQNPMNAKKYAQK